MGHERVGLLPRSERWRSLVESITRGVGEEDVAALAGRTTELLRKQLRDAEVDTGVRATFQFLVLLAISARESERATEELSAHGIRVPASPTPLDFVRSLRDWVASQGDVGESSELAIKAAGDAICLWFAANRAGPRPLFQQHDNAFEIWQKASTGAGFCELARQFFARFTERHLNYYLEREASAATPSLEARDTLQKNLQDHVDRISKHAFETAKITESFAAGWFNKRRDERNVSGEEVGVFLRVAFGKLRDELLRERRSV